MNDIFQYVNEMFKIRTLSIREFWKEKKSLNEPISYINYAFYDEISYLGFKHVDEVFRPFLTLSSRFTWMQA